MTTATDPITPELVVEAYRASGLKACAGAFLRNRHGDWIPSASRKHATAACALGVLGLTEAPTGFITGFDDGLMGIDESSACFSDGSDYYRLGQEVAQAVLDAGIEVQP